MARRHVLRVGALNIKTKPETPETYAALMRRAHRSQIAVRFRGERYGLIGSLSPTETDEEMHQVGNVDLFTELDLDKPWFNRRSRQQAADEEVQTIKVPPHLRPQHANVAFVFFPRHHRLFFDAQKLGPPSARTLFERILNSQEVRSGGHPVTVLVEQDADELEKIYALKELRSLEIVVTRPNPDDLGGYEKKLKEEMKKQRARSLTTSYEAEEGKSLEPSLETKRLADIALSDGSVVGVGRNEQGRRVQISTESHPLKDVVTYDPENLSHTDALVETAEKLLKKIKKRRE